MPSWSVPALLVAAATQCMTAESSTCTPFTPQTVACHTGECYNAGTCACEAASEASACLVDPCEAAPCPQGMACKASPCGGCHFQCARPLYDCAWEEADTPWPEERRAFCCAAEGVRCPSPQAVQAAIACHADGPADPSCCRRFGSRCRHDVYNCSAPALKASAQEAWCCTAKNECPARCSRSKMDGAGCCEMTGVCNAGYFAAPVFASGEAPQPRVTAPFALSMAGEAAVLLANPFHVLVRARRAVLAAGGGDLAPGDLSIDTIGVFLPDGSLPSAQQRVAWTVSFPAAANAQRHAEELALFSHITAVTRGDAPLAVAVTAPLELFLEGTVAASTAGEAHAIAASLVHAEGGGNEFALALSPVPKRDGDTRDTDSTDSKWAAVGGAVGCICIAAAAAVYLGARHGKTPDGTPGGAGNPAALSEAAMSGGSETAAPAPMLVDGVELDMSRRLSLIDNEHPCTREALG
eukprot:TRINITY_DN7443_c0_g1_i1.p1 TRINITY_DN7443_c0_g1~~TRINITY_DN7443_c0_g1_i1.p1  ORF type:complete len:514 (+),score=22.27 TRINITY_DN7443_c0_g1_i1:143-1543(+)